MRARFVDYIQFLLCEMVSHCQPITSCLFHAHHTHTVTRIYTGVVRRWSSRTNSNGVRYMRQFHLYIYNMPSYSTSSNYRDRTAPNAIFRTSRCWYRIRTREAKDINGHSSIVIISAPGVGERQQQQQNNIRGICGGTSVSSCSTAVSFSL